MESNGTPTGQWRSAVRVGNSGAGVRRDRGDLAAFLPIAASALQLWRCLERRAGRIAALTAATLAVLATGCTTYAAFEELSRTILPGGTHGFGGGIASLGLIAGNFGICGRLLMLNRNDGIAVSAECLLLGAYIAHAVLFIAAYGVADAGHNALTFTVLH